MRDAGMTDASGGRDARRRARGRHRRPVSFYERALGASDRDLLAEAGEVDSLDDEVALLRFLVHRMLEDQPEDAKTIESGLRLLIQALTARHRLTGGEAANLSESVADVLRHFGDQLLAVAPEGGRHD